MRAVVVLFSVIAAGALLAAGFVDVAYDAKTDEIIVRLAYRGTNPHHRFSLAWGKCQKSSAEGKHEIAARIHDDQWDDRAQQPFETSVRFPLSDLTCRPATVTLFTEPNFRTSIFVPARAKE